jgi:PAS domain S-box-containing protein
MTLKVAKVKDEAKTKAQLAAELKALRRHATELEKMAGSRLRAEEQLKRELAESRQAYQRIENSEEKFRLLFNSTRDAMFVHHPTADNMPGTFVEVNDTACQMLGRTRKELFTMRPHNIANLKKARYGGKEAMAILAKERNLLTESVFVHKDGTEFPVEINIHLFELQGRPAVLSVARDITERKKIDEVINLERDKAQRYLDVAGVMMLVLDAHGNVSLINEKGCRILGCEKVEDVVGCNWFDTYLPETVRGEVKAVFNKLMAGKVEPVEYYENPIITRDGQERIIAWHNTVLRNENGIIIGTLASGDDITQRKRAEEKLKQDERKIRELATAYVQAQEEERQWITLEIHDRLVQTLTATFHQLQTLKSMPGAEPEVKESTAVAFNLVKEAIRETRNIMKELYPETLAKFGLPSLIREELKRLEEETGCAMSFISNCQMRLPKDIETTFYRIFHEALLNVRKHAAGASKVAVHLNLDNGNAELIVEDNGVGFNAAATKMKHRGPGGFESMLRRAEIIGGKIGIDSQPGRGTRISVRIPLLLLTSK